jgi:hypothetical protein
MPKNAIQVTIAAGQSLSSVADLTSVNLAVIEVPMQVDGGPSNRLNLSFQISDDNITYYDLLDQSSAEVLRTVMPSCGILIDPALTQAAIYLKIRAGSRTQPVMQSADRLFRLVCI